MNWPLFTNKFVQRPGKIPTKALIFLTLRGRNLANSTTKVHSFYQNDCTLILRFHFPKKISFLRRISTRPSGGHSGKTFLTKTEVEKKVMKNAKSSKK